MTRPHSVKNASSTLSLNDGNVMPCLGLGVWETPPDQTAEVVRTAIDLGYRSVDTARLYRNETGVGEALEGHPEIFVTTKLWNDEQGYDEALRAFDESARKLRRKVVDLYLIHWPMPVQNQYVPSWKALVQLQKEGRVRSIGVSNFEVEHLERLMDATGVTPAVNQIELHPYFQQKKLRAFHERHAIQTESWRPLGKGTILEDRTITAIAGRYKRTPAQIILRWHVQSNLVVIPKSVNPSRLKENLDIFDFSLGDDDMVRIAGLDQPDGRMGPEPMNPKF